MKVNITQEKAKSKKMRVVKISLNRVFDLEPVDNDLFDPVLHCFSAVVAEDVFVEGRKGGAYRLRRDVWSGIPSEVGSSESPCPSQTLLIGQAAAWYWWMCVWGEDDDAFELIYACEMEGHEAPEVFCAHAFCEIV